MNTHCQRILLVDIILTYTLNNLNQVKQIWIIAQLESIIIVIILPTKNDEKTNLLFEI